MLDSAASGATRRNGPARNMKIVLAIDPAQPRDVYRDALLAAGARPDEVHLVQPGDEVPREFDGLLVSGGADVDPARYGEAPVNATVAPNAERDALDFALVARSAEIGAAVFGICRGLQVLNVALGGTLWQDLPSQRPRGVTHSFSRKDGNDPARPAHLVRVTQAGRGDLPLAAALAVLDGEPVNSRHHQAVKDLAAGLVPLATSPDELVEAFARRAGPFLAAVQWHPEDLVGEEGERALLASFLDAARERAAHRRVHEPRNTEHEPSAAASGRPERPGSGGANVMAPSGADRPGERIAPSRPNAGGVQEPA